MTKHAYTYDGAKQQLLKDIQTDENGAFQQETLYGYDDAGNQISVDTNHKTLQKVVSGKRTFCYNEDSQLVKQTNEDGDEITYLYDANGNRIKELTEGQKTTGYVYDTANFI